MRGLSGFRAGLLGTGAFGALSIALALMSATTPASAACTPTASGAASGTQTCTGGDSSISYTATGGSLTVNLNNDLVTGPINITDDAGARAITVNDGSATQLAAAITSSDAAGHTVFLQSSGGNVSFTSIKGGTLTYNGTFVGTSSALSASTTGSGTITLTTGDTVTNTDVSGNGQGIAATAVDGAVVINAGANVTTQGASITAFATGAGPVTINAGSAAAPITVTNVLNQPFYALLSQTGSGANTVNLFGTSNGEIGAFSNSGLTTLNITGNVTEPNYNAIFATNISGNIVANLNGGTITSTLTGAFDSSAVN